MLNVELMFTVWENRKALIHVALFKVKDCVVTFRITHKKNA
jgi:hypothetical protein